MASDTALSRIMASTPVRRAVNRGFHLDARRRVQSLATLDPARSQWQTLRRLLHTARATRFGRDHDFATIRSVAEFQKRVPIRSYEALWRDYLAADFPRLDHVTWPGVIPYFALTSGTTQGATKYIPVSRAMLASNQKAARTMVAYHLAAQPTSDLFRGKIFFLGGSTNLDQPVPGVRLGDLSGIAAEEASDWLRPFTFPPLDLALDADWDRKLTRLADLSRFEPITMISGVPSWLLALFARLLDLTGKATMTEVWPTLEVVVHGGVKFDPYRRGFEQVLGDPRIRLQETYPCSEGFIAFGDPATGHLRLALEHGLFYEFIPVIELDREQPTRHWLGNVEPGVNYAIVVSTCAGLWGHLIGDTVRFVATDPPLITFTGRTKYTLSAFGEHLISEEIEAAITVAADSIGAEVREWHVGPVFAGALGHHHFVIECARPLTDAAGFRRALDADLIQRNADYQAHRAAGVGLPLPELSIVRPGGFEGWMRAKGKLGGQHKVPRIDPAGTLTAEISAALSAAGAVVEHRAAGA